MSNKPSSFIWYELMTTDADAAGRFYGAVVGWKVIHGNSATTGGQDYRMIVRSDGGSAGGVLQLTPQMCEAGAHPIWLGYLHVNDVDTALKAIDADGGGTLMPKRSLPVGEIAMVSDLAGAPIYVMHPRPPPGQPDAVSDVFHPEAPQHVCWNELASHDLARSKAFYARHFGFEFNEVLPMGALGDYCFIDHGGQRIGAMMQMSPENPVAGWLFYFGVPSVAASQRAIEAGGGRVIRAAHEVPGGGWICIAADPQGAVFGVVGAA